MVYFAVLALGHKNSDTQPFDDIAESRVDFEPPRKLRALSVWEIPGAIAGLQAYYEDAENIVPGVRHQGEHDTRSQRCRTIVLDDGEYFNSLTCFTGGLHTYIVNGFTIGTNTSRSFSFGNCGLPAQAAEIPTGHCILGFYGGLGGHLHELGVYTRQWLDSRVYLYVLPSQKQATKVSIFGRPTSTTTYGEAPGLNEYRNCYFSGMRLWYTRASLCKVETHYRVYGRIKKYIAGTEDGISSSVVNLDNEEMVGLGGRTGNFVNALEVKTTERTYKSGTTAGLKVALDLPEGRMVQRIQAGISGYVQCLKVTTRQRPPMICPSSQHGLFAQQSQIVGGQSSEYQDCDDTAALAYERSLRLHSLTIYHGQGHIYGFRNKFLIQGKPRSSPAHIAPGFNPATGHQNETVRLLPGEFIISLSIKTASDAVDGIVVITSTNKHYSFGDVTPPLTTLKAQCGCAFSALAGGLGDGETGQLQYVKAYSGWLDPYTNYIPIFGILESNIEIYRKDLAGNPGNQRDFNDLNMINRGDIVRIGVISCYLDDGVIKGFETRYFRSGKLDPEMSECLESKYEAYPYTPFHVFLCPMELIVSVGYQYNGQFINYLEIRTNMRQSGVGIGKKNVEVEMGEVEEKGKCVGGFGGEVGPQGLTQLYVWTRPTPEVVQSY